MAITTRDIIAHIDALNCGPIVLCLSNAGSVMADVDALSIRDESTLTSTHGWGDGVEDAILEFWRNITAIEGGRYATLLIRDGERKRYARWNGVAFKDVTKDFEPFGEAA